jgi:hypothetical protein
MMSVTGEEYKLVIKDEKKLDPFYRLRAGFRWFGFSLSGDLV